MSTFDSDRKNEKKLEAVVDYFKLLYIEDICNDKSLSTFKMLNGDKLLKKTMKNNEERLISLDATNYSLVQDLRIFFEKVYLNNTVSNSKYMDEVCSDLEWLNEIVSKLDAEEKASDTIVRLLSYKIYDNMINENIKLSSSKEKIMQKRINEISNLTQKKENN